MYILVELRIDNEALKDSGTTIWSFNSLEEVKEAWKKQTNHLDEAYRGEDNVVLDSYTDDNNCEYYIETDIVTITLQIRELKEYGLALVNF